MAAAGQWTVKRYLMGPVSQDKLHCQKKQNPSQHADNSGLQHSLCFVMLVPHAAPSTQLTSHAVPEGGQCKRTWLVPARLQRCTRPVISSRRQQCCTASCSSDRQPGWVRLAAYANLVFNKRALVATQDTNTVQI